MNEHTPLLSIWPLLVGLALTLIVAGILSSFIVTLVGVILLLYSLWAWVQENRATDHAHQMADNEESRDE